MQFGYVFDPHFGYVFDPTFAMNLDPQKDVKFGTPNDLCFRPQFDLWFWTTVGGTEGTQTSRVQNIASIRTESETRTTHRREEDAEVEHRSNGATDDGSTEGMESDQRAFTS